MGKFVFACLLALAMGAAIPKNLAGPPSEFPLHVLPQPSETFQTEGSALLKVTLSSSTQRPGVASQSVQLPIDSNEYFQFSVFSPISSYLSYTLTNANGDIIDIGLGVLEELALGDTGNSVPCTSWVLTNPVPGMYTLTIESSTLNEQQLTAATQANQVLVLMFNYDNLKIDAYVNTFSLETGNSVGLVAKLDDGSVGTITSGELDVIFPDGTEQDVQMHDDGLHDDGEANDGIWGGSVVASEAGTYNGEAIISGTTSSGVAFIRTAQIAFSVVDDHNSFTGQASTAISASSDERIVFNVGVSDATSNKYAAYAEVYGTDASGSQVAVAWVGGMVVPTATSNGASIALELDGDWLSVAKAAAPFVLKSVSIRDANTGVIVATASEIKVQSSHEVAILGKKAMLRETTEITERMLKGIRPAHYVLSAEDEASDPPLLLSHGYCAGDNPWATFTEWTDPHFFLDSNANRGNDDFALLLHRFSEQKDIDHKWSGIGHSQGGIALTHLYNYYWSGLDNSPRPIQSVGSPYKGNSIAGSTADLGTAFGVGCGANTDMTPGGAELWLAGISADTRSKVFYYTTTYKLGNLFGDWCNIAVNAILEWPNDGVTELDYATLPGANNMGNTQKQCHTTEMAYIPQYQDNNRNAAMNAAARQ